MVYERGTNVVECESNGWKENCWGNQNSGECKRLNLDCARMLHESMLISNLMYNNETIVWKERGRG